MLIVWNKCQKSVDKVGEELISLKNGINVAFEQNVLIRPWPPSSAGHESVISVQVADQQNSPLKAKMIDFLRHMFSS